MSEDTQPDLKKARELQDAGNLVAATQAYKDILKRDFDNVEAWHGLGLIGYENNNYDLARDVLWRVLQVAPDRPDIWTSYGRVLSQLRKSGEAAKAFQKALNLAPDYSPAYLEMGISLLQRGEKERAVGYLEKSLVLTPTLAASYLHLAQEGKIGLGDARFQKLQKLAEGEKLHDGSKHTVHFAIARVYENARNYEEAFRHFALGNRYAEYPDSTWKETFSRRFEIAKTLFTREFLAERVSETKRIYTPIFIVGMPRSGTTLTDQIFGTHSEVFAGDELPYLGKYLQRLTQARTRRHFPEGAAALRHADFEQLAKLYQLRVRTLNATKEFITDKMPWNFQLIGFIWKAMPWAKVIHIYRDPVDCGFSNFRSPLPRDIQFSCSFEGFAYYRKIYQDFMDLWRATVPGFFLDLCYEDLVEHPEREIRRVLDYCGLPWEDKLLEFHSTRREIRTMSRNQVSRPLNRESIGYEKKYGKLLDPLKEALRAHGVLDSGTRAGPVSGSARP